jgi:hypothetical protein
MNKDKYIEYKKILQLEGYLAIDEDCNVYIKNEPALLHYRIWDAIDPLFLAKPHQFTEKRYMITLEEVG